MRARSRRDFLARAPESSENGRSSVQELSCRSPCHGGDRGARPRTPQPGIDVHCAVTPHISLECTDVEGSDQGTRVADGTRVSRPLRILHIGNGRAFKIKAIADAFVARGHDVHMLPIPQTDHQWSGITSHQLPETRLPAQTRVVGRLLQVRTVVRRLRPDIVHAHNAWGPGWYGAASGHHPFVIHAYGGDLLPEQYRGRP